MVGHKGLCTSYATHYMSGMGDLIVLFWHNIVIFDSIVFYNQFLV